MARRLSRPSAPNPGLPPAKGTVQAENGGKGLRPDFLPDLAEICGARQAVGGGNRPPEGSGDGSGVMGRLKVGIGGKILPKRTLKG